MKQITFTKEDFSTLDISKDIFDNQFHDNNDCPIARVLTRKFPKANIHVFTFKVRIGEYHSNEFKNSFRLADARRIAKRVEKNGKAVFRFGTDILKGYKY